MSLLLLVSILTNVIASSGWAFITSCIIEALTDFMKHHDYDLLLYRVNFVLVLWILFECISRFKGLILADIAPRVESKVYSILFEHVVINDYQYFIDRKLTEITHSIETASKCTKFILDNTLSVFIPTIFSIAVSSYIFFVINSKLALIFIIWTFSQLIVTYFISKNGIKRSAAYLKSRITLQNEIGDIIKNSVSLIFANTSQYEVDRLKAVVSNERNLYKKALMYVEKSKFFLSVINVISFVIILQHSISLCISDNITISQVAFILGGTVSIVLNLGYIYDEIPLSLIDIGRCKESLAVLAIDSANLMDKSSSSNSSISSKAERKDIITEKKDIVVHSGEIAFENVSFVYKTGSAVKNIFFDQSIVLHGSSKTALVGFSGSGKSTFIKLIMGLYRLNSGKIMIDDQDINDVSIRSLRRNIAYIPQKPYLFIRSIKENISYSRLEATDDEIMEAAIKAGCHEFISKLENGYDTIIGDDRMQISEGQKQQIMIARAILQNAKILIMDEATSSIDLSVENVVNKNLFSLMKDKTVIVIAHKLNTVVNMDRILFFSNGRIIEDGSHVELVKNNSHYASFISIYKSDIF